MYFEDELRGGTRSACKRRYREKGARPQCRLKLGYEFTYLYCAIQPFSGALFSLLLPDMTLERFHSFATHFAKHTQALYGKEQKVLLLCDGATAHRLPSEKDLQTSETLQGMDVSNLILEHLPTAAPELNPVERFFEELRKQLADQIFETIKEVENKIAALLRKYYDNPKTIISLCNYPYLSTA